MGYLLLFTFFGMASLWLMTFIPTDDEADTVDEGDDDA